MNYIFRKQFFLLTVGLLFSFMLLTVGLIQAFNTYFYKQKEAELFSDANQISSIFDSSYEGGELEYPLLMSKLQAFDKDTEHSYAVFWDDKVICSQDNSENSMPDVNYIKSSDHITDVMAGNKVVLRHNLFDYFSKTPFVVGAPIMHGNKTVAAAFLGSSVDQIAVTTYDSYRIIVVFMCLAIVINFAIIFYTSRKFSDPLKQMSDAAKVIAAGNFDKRLNIHTDDEIGILADSFNEMATSLDFQEKKRREFISNISHDLRSPLTSIQGFLQAILDGTIPSEKQEHYLQIVLNECRRLAKMANDMLDINKLDDSESALNLSKFNLNELVTTTLFKFEARGNDEKIKLSSVFCNKNIMVEADEDKIQRVIYNLVDNAIKFTHKYGYVKVITEIKDKKVYVTVKDNGKGISKDEQKRVFERLYKGDRSRGKDKKGSGLGLSIVKEFIKAHNEEITLVSDAGKGSAFTFTLPLVSKGEKIINE